jgi:hypothetical protein
MAMMFTSRTLSVSIDCHPDKAYGFVSNPETLPKWATAFCKSVRKSNGDRLPDVSDEKYSEDVRLVEQDLRTLKGVLER